MKIYTLNQYLQDTFHEKVYKLSLQSGCTCPNRDGTKGTGGCIFCSESGSGDFAGKSCDMDLQIQEAKALISKKTRASKFIAYFQSFSNTYGDMSSLYELYRNVISREEIVALSIGTRPDCIDEKTVLYLSKLNEIKPVWVELGLQSSDDHTGRLINRCFDTKDFLFAYKMLKEKGIYVVTHVILGLPGEDRDKMLETAKFVSELHPYLDGIKIHLLQILKGTRLSEMYIEKPFHVMSLEEYGDIIVEYLKILDERTCIHRFTGDGPKALLIEPEWCGDKKRVLNYLNKKILES